MGTEIFQFQLFGPEKMGFKVGNPTFKSMTKSNFLRPSFLLRYLALKHPCLQFEYFFILFLKHFLSSMIFFCERGIVKCKGCFTSQYTQGKLGQRKVDLVILLDVGLLTLNLIFSCPKSWNWKISVPISKRTSWGFQNSPYFYS